MRSIPRVVTLSLLVAIVSHLHAMLVALRTDQWVPAWPWASLAFVEAALVVLVLNNPQAFTTRDFRLPGIFLATTTTIILTPLPSIVRRYGDLVPRDMVLALTLGMAMVGLTMGVGLRLPERPATPAPTRSEQALPLAIVAVAVVVFPLWIASLRTIPIVDLVRGTTSIDAALARDAALSKLANAPLRIAVGSVRNLYLMFAVGWTVAAVVATPPEHRRRRHRAILLAVGTLGLAGLYALVTTERLVIGQVLLVAIVASVVGARRNLTVKALVLGIAAVGAFPVLFGLRSGVGGLGDTLASLRRRVFFVPGDVMMHYFIEFPARTPHLRGASIPKVSRVTGGETFDLSVHIFREYYQRDVRLVGNANGSFFGVAWANFGLNGVIVWSAVLGLGLVVVDRLIKRLPRRSAAAITGVAAFQTALLTSADISRAVFGFAPGLLDLVAAVAVVVWLDRRQGLGPPASQRVVVMPAPTQSRSRPGISARMMLIGASPARATSPTAVET